MVKDVRFLFHLNGQRVGYLSETSTLEIISNFDGRRGNTISVNRKNGKAELLTSYNRA